jgi:TFIIF-interacting CTD phosphatase-like protein
MSSTTTFLLAINVFHSTDDAVEEIVQVRQQLHGVTVITSQQMRYEWLI